MRSLAESVWGSEPLKVDRDAGIIYGVKVLGLESDNGRTYLPEAAEAAVPLYEGVHVNIDHPTDANGNPKPTRTRSSYDRFGKLQNARFVEGQGIFADLAYLKAHPMADRICEAAERMPDTFGLSHNADGDEVMQGGQRVVRKLFEVRHVDVVADPATTKSLCESRNMAQTTVGKLMESFDARCTKKLQKRIKQLLEDDMMPADAPVDAPAEGADPDQALKDGFRAAMNAVLDDDSLDATAKLAKLKELLETHENLASTNGKADLEEDDSEEEEEDDDQMEARRGKKPAKGKNLTEATCKRLCSFAGIDKPDRTLLETLMKQPDQDSVLSILELARKSPGAKPAGPRSSPASRPLTESKTPAAKTDSKDWAASILN